ncbi:MAG: hypothetical protein JXB39_06180 [Deltaproteobacteria bacterium]|nr:hypothetical protein [Deltaproteobacteria bacterium]
MGSRKHLLWWIAPVVAIGIALAMLGSWVGVRGCATKPQQVSVEDLAPGQGLVEVRGTAHYPVRVAQDYRPSFLPPTSQIVWIFPLFQPGNTLGREIRILVLCYTEPDPILSFEMRSIVGWPRKPTRRRVATNVIEAFETLGYTFAEDWVVLEERPPKEFSPVTGASLEAPR